MFENFILCWQQVILATLLQSVRPVIVDGLTAVISKKNYKGQVNCKKDEHCGSKKECFEGQCRCKKGLALFRKNCCKLA